MMLLAPLSPLPFSFFLAFTVALYSPLVPWNGLQNVNPVALLPVVLIVVVYVCVTSLAYVVASVLRPLELPALVLP